MGYTVATARGRIGRVNVSFRDNLSTSNDATAPMLDSLYVKRVGCLEVVTRDFETTLLR